MTPVCATSVQQASNSEPKLPTFAVLAVARAFTELCSMPCDQQQSRQFHDSATPAIRDFIRGNSSIGGQLSNTFQNCVAIRPIVDPTHPAHGQYGLFATSRIQPHARILDYIGEIHCDDRTESDYDLSLHRFPDGVSVGIDAHKSGNAARFINDYRGISKRPNAVFRDNRLGSGELRMSVWSSSEGIKKGDEILVSYGKLWWRARSNLRNIS